MSVGWCICGVHTFRGVSCASCGDCLLFMFEVRHGCCQHLERHGILVDCRSMGSIPWRAFGVGRVGHWLCAEYVDVRPPTENHSSCPDYRCGACHADSIVYSRAVYIPWSAQCMHVDLSHCSVFSSYIPWFAQCMRVDLSHCSVFSGYIPWSAQCMHVAVACRGHGVRCLCSSMMDHSAKTHSLPYNHAARIL